MDITNKTYKLSVFYSWQSDLDIDNNRKAIRMTLKKTTIDIEEDIEGIDINLDEATRDIPGSPDIPLTIFDKISATDIFVCDLTTINSYSPKDKRKVPNPNVLIELGYAIAILGWGRIIMLFNKAYGDFPKDLPFDIAKRRIIDFKIENKSDNNGKGNLKFALKAAIKTIIEKKPQKTFEKNNLSFKEKKRNRDITNIKRGLRAINIDIMDNFIANLPNIINSQILHYWAGYDGVINSSYFHLYDKNAMELFKKVHEHWNNILAFSHRYFPRVKDDILSFGNPNEMDTSERAQTDYKFIGEERLRLKIAFRELLDYIRDNYIEIDLEETSKYALEDVNKYHNDDW